MKGSHVAVADDTRPTHDAEHHGRSELRVRLVGLDPDLRPVDELQPEVEQLAEPGLAPVLDDHVSADLQREIVWRYLTREVSAVYRGREGMDRLFDLLSQLAITLAVSQEGIG